MYVTVSRGIKGAPTHKLHVISQMVAAAVLAAPFHASAQLGATPEASAQGHQPGRDERELHKTPDDRHDAHAHIRVSGP